MKKLIRTINNPQNIYVLGYTPWPLGQDFIGISTTDDYDTHITLSTKNNRDHGFDNEGFIYIVTESELLESIKSNPEDWLEAIEEQEEWYKYSLIKDFTGDIYVDVIPYKEADSILPEDYDINDYIRYQLDDERPNAGLEDIVIVFDSDFEVYSYSQLRTFLV